MPLVFIYYHNHRHKVESIFHREIVNTILQLKNIEGNDSPKTIND